MPRTGRPKAELVLTAQEREQLTRWSRRHFSAQAQAQAQALALRSRIILGYAEGADNKTVGARLGCSENTVGKWRRRLVAHRLDALTDEQRPRRPRTISIEQVEDVIVATLESTPANATHWSRAKMAERTGLSRTTIGKIWSDFGLKPHRVDHFKLSTDPLFIDELNDVVGLYLNPPEAAVVLCVDEKSQVQALQRSQPAFPMMPGMPERRTHDYVRHGTTCDDYGTHKHPIIKTWLADHPRVHLHFAPAYSSWLNLVERFFGYVTADVLQRSDHRSVQALEKDIRIWVQAWNEDPKVFVWTKTADQIISSLGRLIQRTGNPGR